MADNPYLAVVGGTDTIGSAPAPIPAEEPNQGTIAAAPGNPYVDYLKRQQQASLTGASVQAEQHTPDQYAEALKLSKDQGVPPAVALNNREQLAAAAQQAEFQRTLRASPILANWLEHPDNMGVAQDDVSNLAKLESAIRPGTFSPGGWELIPGLPVPIPTSAIRSMAAQAPGGVWELLRGLGASSAGLVGDFAQLLGTAPVAYDAAKRYLTGQKTTEAQDWYFRNSVQPWFDRQADLLPGQDATFGQKAVNVVGGAIGTLNQIALSGGAAEAPAAAELAPFLRQSIEHVVKAMAVPSVVKAIDTGRSVYAATSDPVQAMRAAVSAYEAATVTGALPVSVPGRLLTRVATGAAVGVPSTMAAHAIEEAGLPQEMRQPLSGEDLAIAAFTSAVLAAGGPREAPDTAAHFRGVDQAVDGAKLPARSPDAFADLLKGQVQGHASVYMPLEAFETYYQARGEDPATAWERLAGSQDGFREATETGADLQIPYDKYLARLTPDERAGLTPHLRTTTQTMTAAQAQAHEAAVQQLLGEQAGQEAAVKEPDKGSQEVYDAALRDLQATGRFTKRAAATNATVVREYYARRAERLGKTPMELYQADLSGPGRGFVAGQPGGGLRQPAIDRPLPPEIMPPETQAKLIGPASKEHIDAAVGAFKQAMQRGLLTFDSSSDVPYLGSSNRSGSTILFNRDAPDTVDINGRPMQWKGTVALHEFVEKYLENLGYEYNHAHNAATDAEHAEVETMGFKAEDYEKALEPLLREAAAKKDPQVRPDLEMKPEEHPHSKEERRIYQEVNKQQKPDWAPRSRAAGADRFEQPGARGSINFMTGGGARITMGKNADFSTFVHEFAGHLFLDNLIRDAGAEGADPQLAKDLDTVLEHLGMKSRVAAGEAGIRKELTAAQHELFATSAEAYFREGKAPSLALRHVFERFRLWLTSLYRDVKQLIGQGYTVPLSDEVRGVMDRLLASEDAIQAAHGEAGDQAVLPVEEMRKLGVSEAKLRGYSAALEAAKDELSGNLLADLFKKRDAAYRAKVAAKVLEVEREVANDPVYQAIEALAHPPADAPDLALSKDELEARYGDEFTRLHGESILDALGAHGIKAKAEAPPLDIVAAVLGYGDGDELVRTITDKVPRGTYIDAEAARRVESEDPDGMLDGTMQEKALAALHNNKRAQVLQSEMELLAGLAQEPVSDAAATKEAAKRIIAGKILKEVTTSRYLTAERRAGNEAAKLAAKGKYAEALVQKRRQAVNAALYGEAQRFKTEEGRGMRYLGKFESEGVRKKVQVDIRDQIDDLLERFDMRQKPPAGQTRQEANLAQWVQSQRDLGYVPVTDPSMMNPAVRMHFKDMSVTQFRGLVSTVKSLEQIGKHRQEVTIEGKKMVVEQAAGEMIDKMKEKPDRFTDAQLAEKARPGVDPYWRVSLDRLSSLFRNAIAEVKAQHFKANQYDQHQVMGPWHRYFFEPVIGANYHYLDLRRAVANDFRAAAKKLGREWQETLPTIVENHHLMDNSLEQPQKRRLTRGDLLSIALHVGNESNFDKLAKGMQWEPADIWQTLHDNLTEKDWQGVRVMADALAKHWPEVEAMNRRLGNTEPDRIQPRPFQTKFGEQPGWYAPIKYDPVRSKLGVKQADRTSINPAEGLFSSNYYRADTTTNGSLNSRISNYHDFIDLNWHALERSIHDTIRDLAYREALIDAHKLLVNPELRQQFQRSYGAEAYQHLQIWLGRLANSEVTDERTSYLTTVLQTSRRAVVASGVALRISTVEKHALSAGIKSFGFFSGGGMKYFLPRLAAIGTDHGKQVVEALAKFPEIRARYEQQDRDFSQTIASLVEPESIHSRAERFGHSWVASFDFLTAVPTAHAAYDWATTEGIPKRLGGTGQPMSEADAIKFASSMVREAHGSNIEAARSNLINNRSELVKTLTMLHGFMNNSLGQHLDMVDKLRTAGMGKPEILARYFAALIVPGLVVGAVVEGIKEGQPWWEWAAGSIAGEYAGMVPQLREAYAQVVKGWHQSGLPPWLKALVELAKPAVDVKKAAEGENVKAPIKDTGNAAGLFLPGLSQIGATTQFLYDVHAGEQTPQTVWDWARGISSGSMTQH